MSAARTQGWGRGAAERGGGSYLGWSHRNQRLEMMDLPSYVDSLQEGYHLLSEGYRAALSTAGLGTAAPGWGWPGMPWEQAQRPGRHSSRADGGGHGRRHGCGCGHRHHEHHEHHEHHGHHGDHSGSEYHRDHGHDHDCGSGSWASCRCDCCIEDADIVVYAHCGETRVIPIEVENDTRRERDDVTVEVSDVRTAGGRILPWPTVVTPEGPLTLRSCSMTRLEVLVRILCTDHKATGTASEGEGERQGAGTAATFPHLRVGEEGARGEDSRTVETGDVDECVVGYLTVRLGGCVTRPIVVAVAVLPDSCGSYRTGCACSCC